MTINDLSSLAPRQHDLLRRLLPQLDTVTWIQAVWLSGSLARGDADRWSNINLHVLVDVTPEFDVASALCDCIDAALPEGWHCRLRTEALIRGFSLIPDRMDVTRGGAHFDVRWVGLAQLQSHLDRYRPLRLLAVQPALSPALRDYLDAPWPPLTPPDAESVAANLSYFWITLSHLPALVNRAEHLAAVQHLNDARQSLTDLVVALNGAQRPPSRSRINQYLGPLQLEAFEKTLPIHAVSGDSWIGQAVALIVLYRWYAPQLVDQYAVAYPTALERSVLALLSAEVDGWPVVVKST
jgi:hypothetical protein